MSTHTIQYEGIKLEFELIRKNVKYINLRVNKHGNVVVSASKKVPLSVIEEFVQSKSLWIITHLAEIEKLRKNLPPTGFFDGKTLYYLGKPYQLVLSKGPSMIVIQGDKVIMSSQNSAENALHAEYLLWLKKQSSMVFEEVMDHVYPMVEPYGISRPTIQIRNMKTLWGSCTTGGNTIRLNLQLIKASKDCIEQVVLHELLHFLHKNHGKEFYALLSQLMPDWQDRKSKLEAKFKDGT
ncbi:M48 family metallopeptidase [Anaerotignum sp. MB30-C6]|uniref:M48 family metallopeptidase n=1 Tax=Anaerotignum sp. MB30-C6 TaxID=3070814 RepID=UPI0027DDE857|nr:SprT family zinc-dependent metalloprotease [Anaerotignum sp. MB30-C6]WMI81438.1 SprT family zinc-dependent metalloprotease [Anaerotignum sp. MB30-C6]